MSGASTTALMTAFLRSVHARRETAPLFVDPYGDRLISAAERRMLLERFSAMLSDAERARVAAEPDPDVALDLAALANPAYGGVVARQRWCEDQLERAVAGGVRQYVIAGAGLDSFALRRPAWAGALTVFEIDTAETLASKRERIAAAGLDTDARVHATAADLARDGIGTALATTPYDRDMPSFVACLGVLPYLGTASVRTLLTSIADTVAAGSTVAFDYLEPEAVVGSSDAALSRVRAELAASGPEIWRSGVESAALAAQLATLGLHLDEDLDGDALAVQLGAPASLVVTRRLHVSRATRER